jgi:hypothetical protein
MSSLDHPDRSFGKAEWGSVDQVFPLAILAADNEPLRLDDLGGFRVRPPFRMAEKRTTEHHDRASAIGPVRKNGQVLSGFPPV